ncbi:hypothetical protein GCM10009623_12680 [Nocardioides aestuarii]|uniref:CHRD domain-containing protein n=1 Tax=Nocardioides aestuarii TaxID=252231 RepID=A0ABW4TL13_9ACTN
MRTTRSTTLLLVAATAATLALASAPASGHDDDRADYRTRLDPLNKPGSEGRVRLRVEDATLHVRLRVKGLDDGPHIAHIHGIRQAENECPGFDADADGNGFVDLVEGLPSYGPVQRTLSVGLDDVGRRLRYRRDFTALDDGSAIAALGDLSQYAIVVHGVDLDDDGVVSNADVNGDGDQAADNEISMPALCGEIEHHH